jgi:hypothetical protein
MGTRQPPTTANELSKKLSKKWGISLKAASNTIKVTTQRGVSYSVNSLHWRWRTRQLHLLYPSLNTTVYSDTMSVKSKSHAGIGGDKCAQLFTTPFDFLKFYPMKAKSETGYQLDKFIHNVGVMKHIHINGAEE